MSQHRSYGRINWNNNRLGLLLVSPSHRFFIFAEPLLAMAHDPGVLKIVKRRNKRPETAVGYHPGAIVGRLDHSDGWARIRLYFGEVGQDIEKEEDGRLLNVVVHREYFLPTRDLDELLPAIELMLFQREGFNELSMLADTVPSWDRSPDLTHRNTEQTPEPV